MMHEHFRQALETLDIELLRKMWHHVAPNMPQPTTDEDALKQAHYARTLMPIAFKLRAYSHAWLMERALPSGLPDKLRPSAQRLYPITVPAVGIACGSTSEIGKKMIPLIRGAMEAAVLDAYADGKTDPTFVKARMAEARTIAIKKLVG